MTHIGRRDVLRGFASAGLLVGTGVVPARSAEPVTLRLGYGPAAEEQVWLLIAKPELGKNQGKLYRGSMPPDFRGPTSAPRRSRRAPSIFRKARPAA